MNPKDKAKELFNKLNDKIISFEDVRLRGNGYEMTRQCALIAVDEVIKALEEHQWQSRNTIEDYKQMRLEIEKL